MGMGRQQTSGASVVGKLLIAFLAVAFISLSNHALACRTLKLELDWMYGDKPGCGAFVSEMQNCNWSAWIKDDDANCTFYMYIVDAQPDVFTYLANYENDPKPASGHKVHLLGSEYWAPDSDMLGYGVKGADCCHGYGTVCVQQCRDLGPAYEPCASNHEIGHEFGCNHCNNDQCVMYETGPTTPTAFCTTGQNHRGWVSSHNP